MTSLAVVCFLFGHRPATPDRCRCGAAVLPQDGTRTRVRHVLSCFFLGHHYVRLGARHGHHEYTCLDCGHPLLFRATRDPYATRERFLKKVRYLCNLFGHRVHTVTRRAGLTEYACNCGHSFLREEADLERVTHPPVCLVAGHFVRFLEERRGHVEHVCEGCGHTFFFPRAGRAASWTSEPRAA